MATQEAVRGGGESREELSLVSSRTDGLTAGSLSLCAGGPRVKIHCDALLPLSPNELEVMTELQRNCRLFEMA